MAQRRYKELRNDRDFWKHLEKWWASLNDDRGQRAALRRAKSPEDVLAERAFWRGPVAELRSAGYELHEDDQRALAFAAGLLAHAKTLGRAHTARMLAQHGTGSAEVRDIRLRRLLAVADEDHDGLYQMLRRLVRLLGDAVEPRSLFNAACRWDDAQRRQWAREYYTAPTKNN